MSKFNLTILTAIIFSSFTLTNSVFGMEEPEEKTSITTKLSDFIGSDNEEEETESPQTLNFKELNSNVLTMSPSDTATFIRTHKPLQKALSENDEDANLWVLGYFLEYEMSLFDLFHGSQPSNAFYDSLIKLWKSSDYSRIEELCKFKDFECSLETLPKRIAGFIWFDYQPNSSWYQHSLFNFVINNIDENPNDDLSVNAAFNILSIALASGDAKAIEWIHRKYLGNSDENWCEQPRKNFLRWISFHLTTDQKEQGTYHWESFPEQNLPDSFYPLPEFPKDYESNGWGYSITDRQTRLGAAAFAYAVINDGPSIRYINHIITPIFGVKFTSQAKRSIKCMKNFLKDKK